MKMQDKLNQIKELALVEIKKLKIVLLLIQ